MKGVAIPGFYLTKSGKIARDTAAQEAKLDLCTRLKRRNSKRVKVKPKGK